VNEIVTAVEEQGATTAEIARNVSVAAVGTSDVSRSILAVSRAAGETGHAASQVLDAASELSTQAERLRLEIDTFLAKGRAA
jgi:methyl-accepting chemotaxis protein